MPGIAGALSDRYVRTEFKIKVEIDGVVFDDEVVAVSATFGLNSIPTASATIACGMNVRTNNVSKIHTALDGLKARTKAKITLTANTTDGKIFKSIIGPRVIFEGYYIGVGMQRSSTNANYILHFVHWLDDLNCGSMLNGNFYPGMPADMAQAAAIQAVSQSRGGGLGPPIPIVDADGSLVNRPNMESDLWGDVLKPMLRKIAEFDHPVHQNCYNKKDNPDLVTPALDRMPNAAPVPGKLKMNLGDVDAELIAMNANKGISATVLNNLGYNSFWSKLVGELGPSFLFGISPGVTFANVIPFFGGLRVNQSSAWRRIRLDDYNYANFNSNMSQLIESVNVFYAFTGNSNLHGGRERGAPTISYCPPVAKFPPPDKIKDFRGVVMVKELPYWLHNTTSVEDYAHEALMPEVDTHKPGEGSSTPTGASTVRPPETVKRHRGVTTNFCKHWYQTMVLGQRYGEFSGKLRFDIAPGSMLAIEVPPGPPPVNPLSEGKEPLFLYASVSQVSYTINAEQHTAGTSFTITNIRNEAENNDDNLTSETPPLYTEKWTGGPLAKEAMSEGRM